MKMAVNGGNVLNYLSSQLESKHEANFEWRRHVELGVF